MKPSLIIGLTAAAGIVYLLTRKSTDGSTQTPSTPALTSPVTPVKALPPLPAAILTVSIPPLDTGLTADERLAVSNAVTKETSRANLLGFANTFDPIFPVAASVLRARAAALP